MHKTGIIACLIVLGVGVVAAVGCSSAEAKPLEVTYYYLPG